MDALTARLSEPGAPRQLLTVAHRWYVAAGYIQAIRRALGRHPLSA